MITFLKAVAAMPFPWNLWVALLATANLASVLFLPRIEAVIVLAAMMLGGMIQAAIFSRMGFVRLLGIGHVLWIPMLTWLWSGRSPMDAGSAFGTWILILSTLNALSLVIDATDVLRYAAGDREPHTG